MRSRTTKAPRTTAKSTGMGAVLLLKGSFEFTEVVTGLFLEPQIPNLGFEAPHVGIRLQDLCSRVKYVAKTCRKRL